MDMGQGQQNPACEAHSISIAVIEDRLERYETDRLNDVAWKREVASKLDAIDKRVTGLWWRVSGAISAALVLAWAYAQWGPR